MKMTLQIPDLIKKDKLGRKHANRLPIGTTTIFVMGIPKELSGFDVPLHYSVGLATVVSDNEIEVVFETEDNLNVTKTMVESKEYDVIPLGIGVITKAIINDYSLKAFSIVSKDKSIY